ncbi:MAG TPA: tRNA pseudouridine(13) synthase TruD [Geobacteraceae bacterium]|nr:tRNA pseudouridine(13) synthase TruD [Geobacteraceae bacterium]
MTQHYPYLTKEIPGTGGIFKESAEDFEVTELPLYPPCGSGEHTYVLVEKTGLTTLEMLRRLAKAVGIQERELGYAGMKDARGITRQTVSVPRVPPEELLRLEIPGLRFLSAELHNNKLRLGHLSGNRFRIRLRQVADGAAQHAVAVLDILRKRGVPNYFGEQRYGSQGNSATVGRKLLQGDHEGAVRAIIGTPEAVRDERWQQGIAAFRNGDLAAALELLPGNCRTEREIVRTLLRKPGEWQRAVKSIHPRLVALYLSACQSELFDRVVAARMPDIDTILAGDIACKHANGACFRVEDLQEAIPRAAAFEISATGPMFGRKMLLPGGAAAEQEAEVLAGSGLSTSSFSQDGAFRLEGERRPLRVPLQSPSAWQEGYDLLLEFALPKGSYATSVLREIMK